MNALRWQLLRECHKFAVLKVGYCVTRYQSTMTRPINALSLMFLHVEVMTSNIA